MGERARIARGVRRHAARIFAEWLRLAASDAGERGAWIDELVEFDPSAERLAALAGEGGQGLLIATAHLGNWELLAAALRRRGLDGAVVGRHRRGDSSSTWLVEMRRGLGIATLAQDEPARRMLEVLRRGATLGILCDLEVRRLDGRFVPFFGRPALTTPALARLSLRTGAPVVPMFGFFRAGGRYRVRLAPPIWPEGRGDDAVAALTARYLAVVEDEIRARPAEWLWLHDRWKE